MDNRLVVPKQLRWEVLEVLHAVHKRTTGMILHASRSLYRPGIYNDIRDRWERCLTCAEAAPSHSKLLPKPQPRPSYPLQQVCMDFMQHASHRYAVMIDSYSRWPSVWRPAGISTADWFTEFYSMFGKLEILSTDGGPEFMSGAMQKVLQDYGVHHRVSTAHNPHYNCRAELGVKSVKRLFRTMLAVMGAC